MGAITFTFKTQRAKRTFAAVDINVCYAGIVVLATHCKLFRYEGQGGLPLKHPEYRSVVLCYSLRGGVKDLGEQFVTQSAQATC